MLSKFFNFKEKNGGIMMKNPIKNKKNLIFMIKISTLTIFLLVILTALGTLNTYGATVPFEEQTVELRGVWVATVDNIDIPKQNGTSESAILAYKNYYLSILDRLEFNNLNAVFFQVRPMNDAFYPSAYNPWSAYLVNYGVDPGWDPLEWMIQVTHERGFEFHAWLNPYRTSSTTGLNLSNSESEIKNYKINYANSRRQLLSQTCNNPLFEANESLFLSKVVMGAEGKLVLNPAHPDVISHIENTIDEIITNYNVDGIHFDDYFYPAGVSYGGVPIENSIDQANYNDYIATNPFMGIADWRRHNVDKMVKAVSDLVSEFNQTTSRTRKVAFGISPSAIWAPAKSPNCSAGVEGGVEAIGCWSYSTYNQLFADTKKWVENEWIDYIAPQAYMKYDDYYPTIVKWWANVCAPTKVKLYIGSAIYRLKEWNNERAIYDQIYKNGTDSNLVEKIHGYILFSYRQMNTSGDTFAKGMSWIRSIWKNKALTPIYSVSNEIVKITPSFQIYDIPLGLRITFNQVENARGYALYRFNEGEEIVFERNKLVCNILQYENEGTRTINFGKDENVVKYVLRTIDANNEFIENYTVVNVEDIIPNSAPIISDVDFTNGKDGLIGGEQITISAKVIDPEANPLTVTLYFASDGINFTRDFKMQAEGDIYSYSWEAYYLNLPNARFKIVASDGGKTTEIISDEINIKASNITIPVLSEVDFGVESSITSGKLIKVQAKVLYDEPVSLKLYFALDGINFDQSYEMKETNGIYSYTWKVPSNATNGARLKIVSSNFEEVSNISEPFEIKLAPPKTNNNCSSSTVIYFLNLFVLSLAVIVIRKRVK